MKRLYAILDTVSDMLVGSVLLLPHDAPAIRLFGDLAADTQTAIGRHPADHELVCLGAISEENQLVAFERETIITGAAWLAAQQKAQS